MKNIHLRFFFFLSILTLFQGLSSCTSKQKVMNDVSQATPIISYTKVKGRGTKLPVYSIEVLDAKIVRYTGIANVPELGVQLLPITDKDYDAIIQAFSSSNFNALKDNYKGRLRDKPLTRVSFDQQTVTFQEEACPGELRNLAGLVEDLIEISKK